MKKITKSKASARQKLLVCDDADLVRGKWTKKLVIDCADGYFAICDKRKKIKYDKDMAPYEVDNPMPYTIEGFCNFAKISVGYFSYLRKINSVLGEACTFVHQKILENRVVGGLDGSQNANFAKFLLINNNSDLYRDRVEVTAEVTGELSGVVAMLHGIANNIKGG